MAELNYQSAATELLGDLLPPAEVSKIAASAELESSLAESRRYKIQVGTGQIVERVSSRPLCKLYDEVKSRAVRSETSGHRLPSKLSNVEGAMLARYSDEGRAALVGAMILGAVHIQAAANAHCG